MRDFCERHVIVDNTLLPKDAYRCARKTKLVKRLNSTEKAAGTLGQVILFNNFFF